MNLRCMVPVCLLVVLFVSASRAGEQYVMTYHNDGGYHSYAVYQWDAGSWNLVGGYDAWEETYGLVWQEGFVYRAPFVPGGEMSGEMLSPELYDAAPLGSYSGSFGSSTLTTTYQGGDSSAGASVVVGELQAASTDQSAAIFSAAGMAVVCFLSLWVVVKIAEAFRRMVGIGGRGRR